MGKLDGKIALITGATSGIGAATAKLFAQEGASVIIVGRNNERGNVVQSQILSNGGNAYFFKCDVTNESDILKLRDFVLKEYGGLDILFNNAGILLMDKLENIDSKDWDYSYKVNVTSHMYMSKTFIDILCDRRGCILNNASIDGLHSNVRGRATYMYSSSKA